MTNDQLDAIEKDAVRRDEATAQILMLVKTLRDARERDEGYVKSMEAYRLDVEACRRRMGDLLDHLAREEAAAHQFQKERNEARAEVERLKAEVVLLKNHYSLDAASKLRAEVAVARSLTALREHERDEARAEVERLTHNFVQTERHLQIIEKSLADSRAEVERLREALQEIRESKRKFEKELESVTEV